MTVARVTVETVGFIRTLFGEPVDSEGGRPTGAPQALVLSVPEGTTVEGLLRLLAERYPAFGTIAYEKGRLTDALQVVIGDRLLDLAGGSERPLVEDDTVVLLPPFEGG